MKKSWKKVLALACAAAMIVPSVAPMSARAAEELGGNIGDSVIENDNSELPDIQNVVLSTITDTTYDFRVDPDKLLHEFNSTLYADTNMFFENDDASRKFVLPDDYSFYIKTTSLLTGGTTGTDDEETSRNTFKALITEGDTTYDEFIEKIAATEYYIWQPVDSEFGTGEGAYVRLSEENIWVVMELIVDEETGTITKVIMEATPRLSEGDVGAIWDGGIYTVSYGTAITNESDIQDDIVPLFDVENWAFDESVYVGLTTPASPAVYYSANDMETSDEFAEDELPEAYPDEEYVQIKFVESKEFYKDKSRAASIVNKSTFDIAVTASVQMTGGEGLVLNPDKTFAAITGADIYLAIEDAKESTKTAILKVPTGSKTAVNEAGETVAVTGEAEAYYILKGTGTESILYTLGEIEELTQSNIYYRYLNSDSNSSNTASFVIAGATDVSGYASSSPNTTAKAAWDAYIQALADETATRPQINIVYSFEKVVANADGNSGNLFANENLDTFTTTLSNGTGWVASTDYTKMKVEFANSIAITDTTTTNLPVASFTGDNANITIKSATIGKQDVSGALVKAAGTPAGTPNTLTLDNTKPAITALLATNASGNPIKDTLTITLTVNGVEKTFTKEVSIESGLVNGTTLAPSSSSVTWTVNNASGVTFTPAKAIVVGDVKSVTVNWTVSGGSPADLPLTADEYTVTKTSGVVVIDTTKVTEITTADKVNKITVVYDINGKDVTVEYDATAAPITPTA